MKIVFATNNNNKLSEIRRILGEGFEVVSLAETGCREDIPETGDTLEENAVQKARYVFDKYGYSCFADDTGLEVYALGGEPGVHSARYAEETDHDSNANMEKLLRKLGDTTERKARFRTVIALLEKKEKQENGTQEATLHIFEGKVEGSIITEKRGNEGFGYDPVFVPEGYDKTFAELGMDIKNNISHRAKAVRKLADHLLK
ncbi:non-canonical purine NTP diphosphatase [Prevotella sp. OH937_COT-195]|uniref:non-canonical purine NTP diphosphatase n=1 Tax=Prevotella sp. OH937_COT-195 TaxID=2491051 RepID=UPI000F646EF6|nr:non-canonical purine NTP diphosphatase [Prevotella sp. OH937_COT-195]RRC99868.1 non-canonical purine NTP diphosphatase [Prevotella sp. OH937_COT-195]